MKLFYKYKYAHFMAAYGIIYMICFAYLEHRTGVIYNVIHCFVDDIIPFCPYFIIPYFLWFIYIGITILYFMIIQKNEDDCKHLFTSLCTGMTLFLIISFIYPNKLELRPAAVIDTNIFTHYLRFLYHTDTPTNVFPSIHVYNSIVAYFAIANCDAGKKYRSIRIFTLLLTVSIVISTMLLKQHSFLDVIFGISLAFVVYYAVYKMPILKQETRNEQVFIK